MKEKNPNIVRLEFSFAKFRSASVASETLKGLQARIINDLVIEGMEFEEREFEKKRLEARRARTCWKGRWGREVRTRSILHQTRGTVSPGLRSWPMRASICLRSEVVNSSSSSSESDSLPFSSRPYFYQRLALDVYYDYCPSLSLLVSSIYSDFFFAIVLL